MIRVRVPASTANLGPGFDAMGLALDWWDDLDIAWSDRVDVEVTGEGAEQVPLDERHLVLVTVRRSLADLGGDADRGLRLRAHNRIPHSRGMGSSAAAIVAGHALAWGLARPGEQLDREWLLDRSGRDEGHPDNAAAAVHGGAVLSWMRSDKDAWGLAHLRTHPELTTRLWVPLSELRTASARQVLPASLPREQVIAQASRAGLLVHALAEAPELLLEATMDWLHQHQRGPLMPHSLALMERLRGAGVPAVVSGAGPAVIAVGTPQQLAAADTVPCDGFTRHAVAIGGGVHFA